MHVLEVYRKATAGDFLSWSSRLVGSENDWLELMVGGSTRLKLGRLSIML